MFLADHRAIIEPEGVVEIKMRRDRLVSMMDRLDPEYSAFKKASSDKSKSAEEHAAATESFKKREADLMPTYKQIALLFADLHEYVSQHGHS
jgi:acetyl-CoA carboxylase/biotin carboxylase 1